MRDGQQLITSARGGGGGGVACRHDRILDHAENEQRTRELPEMLIQAAVAAPRRSFFQRSPCRLRLPKSPPLLSLYPKEHQACQKPEVQHRPPPSSEKVPPLVPPRQKQPESARSNHATLRPLPLVVLTGFLWFGWSDCATMGQGIVALLEQMKLMRQEQKDLGTAKTRRKRIQSQWLQERLVFHCEEVTVVLVQALHELKPAQRQSAQSGVAEIERVDKQQQDLVCVVSEAVGLNF
ncbi:hypothetical protein lerEdw1_007779 [Lerista edwardsae]|nr:hypothetical protein lerEdw1_007779 [Lerista edwardsae]